MFVVSSGGRQCCEVNIDMKMQVFTYISIQNVMRGRNREWNKVCIPPMSGQNRLYTLLMQLFDSYILY